MELDAEALLKRNQELEEQLATTRLTLRNALDDDLKLRALKEQEGEIRDLHKKVKELEGKSLVLVLPNSAAFMSPNGGVFECYLSEEHAKAKARKEGGEPLSLIRTDELKALNDKESITVNELRRLKNIESLYKLATEPGSSLGGENFIVGMSDGEPIRERGTYIQFKIPPQDKTPETD